MPAEQRIDPIMKSTAVRRFVVEFYNDDGGSLGLVKMVIPTEKIGDLTGLAFRMAKPKCLAATRLKIFAK